MTDHEKNCGHDIKFRNAGGFCIACKADSLTAENAKLREAIEQVGSELFELQHSGPTIKSDELDSCRQAVTIALALKGGE